MNDPHKFGTEFLNDSKQMKRGEYEQGRENLANRRRLFELLVQPKFPSGKALLRRFPEGRLSRHCHGSRGKTLKNAEQRVNTEEKLTLALHRNCLILLGKLPLRQIVIELLKWLLTEGFNLFDAAFCGPARKHPRGQQTGLPNR